MAENLPKVGSGTVTLVQKVQSCRQDKPKEEHAETHSYQWLRSLLSKESACSAGDPGLIPGSGRYPGEENGNPLQYSFLENSMYRGAHQATVHGVTRVRHNLATKPPQRQKILKSVREKQQITKEPPGFVFKL